MIEATVNGVSFKSIGLGLKSHNISVLPPTKDNTIEIAEMDGEIDFGSTYGPRTFDLECIVMADDPTIDYHRRVAQVAALFNIKKGDIVFTFSDLQGRKYVGRYAGTMPIEKLIFDGEVTIPIKMSNPYPESDEVINEKTLYQSGDMINAFSDGGVSTSPMIVLTNTGTTTIQRFKLTHEYLIEG
ncbi:phage tail protein [Paenibacillus selenitireducens]|uniref:Phage tail protein n=1 Tax=Paenibacillus selenitireducens TaxID=1324314 RepID=A0A1T2XCH1_9BACL|nr:phage tail domain-containing protein [Paenibacillus selenitireducens]OPA77472.1 phage tail protein [Paenibacillus selenitireducens]